MLRERAGEILQRNLLQWRGVTELSEAHCRLALPVDRVAVHIPLAVDLDTVHSEMPVAALERKRRHAGAALPMRIGIHRQGPLHAAPGHTGFRMLMQRPGERWGCELRHMAAVVREHRIDGERLLATEVIIELRLQLCRPLRNGMHAHPPGASRDLSDL